ncbi:phosphonate ABC transporter ATP-binding protein [Enterococcus sp. HY326]|uniref:phosphonate ABC transporter ATP-binding protein n=1 Tax=Enterococcus sp. HY326 TaxID=2971265 RepID=UPI00223F1D4A|nr:phosphonate ABC transporter ATP-binding protein [Enterococcus sp. HY326]
MIEFQEVTKLYPNGVVGLENINLTISQGEFVAIIGASGAGKSTLIRTINGLTAISSGSLKVNGIEISKLKGRKLRNLRQNIGMVFQSYNLVPRISVLRNVLSSYAPHLSWIQVLFGWYPRAAKLGALESLNRVGILDKAFIRTDQLSGGQQQRVSLARALNQNPDILLADEPVAALDPVTAKEVMDDFKKINKELNKIVIINIHHVELALEYAHRIIAIKDGAIFFDGPVSAITNEVLDEIYRKSTTSKPS